jgi:hypothetical protein
LAGEGFSGVRAEGLFFSGASIPDGRILNWRFSAVSTVRVSPSLTPTTRPASVAASASQTDTAISTTAASAYFFNCFPVCAYRWIYKLCAQYDFASSIMPPRAGKFLLLEARSLLLESGCFPTSQFRQKLE